MKHAGDSNFDLSMTAAVASGRICRWLLAAVLLIATLTGCGGGGSSTPRVQGPPSSSLADRFDFLWNTFDQQYPYFDYKGVDWNALRSTYRPQALAASGDQQLAATIGQMLGNLNDLHVHLVDPGGKQIATTTEKHFINFDAAVWQQYLQSRGSNIQQHSGFITGSLGGVPYLAIQTWGSNNVSISDLDAALEAYRSVPHMIIDVRMNGGGDSSIAYKFAGRFADQTHSTESVRFRNGPGHGDFGPLQQIQVTPRGPWQFTGQVMLLIGHGCASSNEEFVAAMRRIPTVTIVGDDFTGGHSGNPALFDLGNGWQFTVSRWQNFYEPEHVMIEDNGIPSSVFISSSASDFQQGKDPVLDYAMTH